MSEYPYPFTDENDKVVCQICGKSYLVISSTHLHLHGVSYDEYKYRFPDAPLSSSEFKKRGMMGKDNTIFVKETLKEIEDADTNFKEIQQEEFPDFEPTVDDEVDFEKSVQDELGNNDIFSAAKNKILDHLRTFFTNVRKDYKICVYNPSNILLFQFITDFADPVLKIDIEFPNTFWHNQDSCVDSNRNYKLKESGWKVIEIKSKAPTYEEIKNAIERK